MEDDLARIASITSTDPSFDITLQCSDGDRYLRVEASSDVRDTVLAALGLPGISAIKIEYAGSLILEGTFEDWGIEEDARIMVHTLHSGLSSSDWDPNKMSRYLRSEGSTVEVKNANFSNYRTAMAQAVLPEGHGMVGWELEIRCPARSPGDFTWGVCKEDLDVEWNDGEGVTEGVCYPWNCNRRADVAPAVEMSPNGVVRTDYTDSCRDGARLQMVVDTAAREITFFVNGDGKQGPVSYAYLDGHTLRPCLDLYHDESHGATLHLMNDAQVQSLSDSCAAVPPSRVIETGTSS